MMRLLHLHDRLFAMIEAHLAPLLPVLARLVFAATLMFYYWNSALTKLGDGLFGIFRPSVSAYVQILPRMAEAVSYDTSQIALPWHLLVLGATWGELLFPLLILLGLFTRLAALGMIGFVIAQSWVDVVGHGVAADDLGRWFDRVPDSLILDQRAFWVFLLLTLVLRGGGVLSLDTLLRRGQSSAA
ncbi:DoxX family membrane protein [Nioella nitratireducens]|uniref:DoxX family membrane protein n=1 Tax=Nioella nitratireducens TaxID=1287720 RepID=UPI0008FCEA5B|nr:DoxX family membrane protein [Nioella nitratireducens]